MLMGSFRKGYLTREKQGQAFVYSPRYSREDFERGMAQEVLGRCSEASVSLSFPSLLNWWVKTTVIWIAWKL